MFVLKLLKLKRSGYSEKFREKLILKAKAAYKKIVHNDFLGLKPMYRNSEEQNNHRKNKSKTKKWWNKGGKTYSNVLFVPATPGGVLASRMQKRIAELNPSSVNQLKVIEKGGIKLKNILVEKDPFGKNLCQNPRCPVCYETEYTKPAGHSKIPCTTMSVGYQIRCNLCDCRYEGETGRTIRIRQLDHLSDLENRRKDTPLVKHWLKMHPSQKPKFKIKILKKFSDPLTRQVDEGLRIYQTNPELILNSKSEANHPKIMRISLEGST